MPIIKIDPDLCTNCGTCIQVCPLDVLRLSPEGKPFIAYQEDCQSCYICAVYCQTDALVVTPDRGRPTPLPL